jgi:hypothetical protein
VLRQRITHSLNYSYCLFIVGLTIKRKRNVIMLAKTEQQITLSTSSNVHFAESLASYRISNPQLCELL